MSSPVLFLIFNRPEQTMLVFEQIRIAKPQKLFIASDGPRKNRKEDIVLCEQTRKIVDMIDWDCELHTLFRKTNLGCGQAVSGAIDWFFENVEEGIILEDDCLPNQTFFTFCEELLSFYREDEKITHISGSNHQLGHWRGDASYYFSNFIHIWGWATWRRAWRYYNFRCENFDKNVAKKMPLIPRIMLNQTINGGVDTWDFQWNYAVKKQDGIGIIPNVSLVKNIGYDSEATHTNSVPYWFSKMKYGEISTIVHPSEKSIDLEADLFSEKILGWGSPKAYLIPMYYKIKKYLK